MHAQYSRAESCGYTRHDVDISRRPHDTLTQPRHFRQKRAPEGHIHSFSLARLRFATSQRHREPRTVLQPCGSGGTDAGSTSPSAVSCSEALEGATPSLAGIGAISLLEPRGFLYPAPPPPSPTASPAPLVSGAKPNANPLRCEIETGKASAVGVDCGGVVVEMEGELEMSKDIAEGATLSQATSLLADVGEIAISSLEPRGVLRPPPPVGSSTAPTALFTGRSKPNAIFSLDERGVLRPPLGLFTGDSSYSVTILAPTPNAESCRPPPPNNAARL